LFHRQKAKVNVDNAFAGFTNTAYFKLLARVNSNKNKMGRGGEEAAGQEVHKNY
jgi:hypothetical protein